jgi:16S rRNA G966 N2-methylase RsmD
MSGVMDERQLFEIEAPPPVSLADKFGVPPFSVLDRRGGAWQDRKRQWGRLGIQSEIGRDSIVNRLNIGDNGLALMLRSGAKGMGVPLADGISVFDPVVCELAYRWHTLPGDRILDPFAGGSVRGIVASTLARWYVGVDLRGEQIEANEAQAHLGSDIAPRWIQGDSARLSDHLGPADEFDFVFSCPPYADLEVYSDNPRDLSRMPYEEFRDTHARIIAAATARLRNDRFAAWVISDVRDKRGAYRGLVVDTIRAFEAAGLSFHNDAVLLDQVGTAAVRAERPFRATRKLTRVHQHLLIFVKGDAKRAATRLEDAA